MLLVWGSTPHEAPPCLNSIFFGHARNRIRQRLAQIPRFCPQILPHTLIVQSAESPTCGGHLSSFRQGRDGCLTPSGDLLRFRPTHLATSRFAVLSVALF